MASASDEYGADEPLGGYAALAATFNLAVLAGLVLVRRSRGRLPERVETRDVLLLGAATYKLSRLLTKARVTSFLRAPFTRRTGKGAPGEVEEEPRGEGLQRAVGKLLVCPYCIGTWIASALAFCFAFAPRLARFVAAIAAATAVADLLQLADRAAKRGAGLTPPDPPETRS